MTNRTDFNETWLMEMPKRISSTEMFSSIEQNIKELINSGNTLLSLGNNLYKMESNDSIFYWYQNDKDIILACELYKRSQGLIMQGVGKNEKYKGQPPTTIDLYDAILNDSNRSIRLLSDNLMTDQGANIWKRLFRMGHKISVYDEERPGQTFKTINSETDFDQYFGTDKNLARYQFVLSENKNLGECRNYFNTRRMYELCGYDLSF